MSWSRREVDVTRELAAALGGELGERRASIRVTFVLQEVTVTATRHEEPLSKVPISISAFSQEQMDAQGVRELDDLVRLTPGLNINHVTANGANQIAIRGVSSAAGSGTTGVYIDDTPIQVRNLGFAASTAFPGLFATRNGYRQPRRGLDAAGERPSRQLRPPQMRGPQWPDRHRPALSGRLDALPAAGDLNSRP